MLNECGNLEIITIFEIYIHVIRYYFGVFILFIRIDIEGVNIHNMILAYDYIWASSHLIEAQFFHAV